MKVRIISALVGIALIIALLIFGEKFPLLLFTAISIVTAIILSELLLAKGMFENYKISVPTLLFGILTPLLSTTPFKFIPIYVFTVIIFSFMILYHSKVSFSEISFVYATSILVVLGMTCIVLSCNLNSGKYPSFFIVSCLGIPWMADAGAYFVGTFFGKHKLCPNISPKKTVEGAIGGVAFGIIGAVLIGMVYGNFLYTDVKINMVLLIIIGFVNSLVSIMGDLSFSLIKRGCHIKDYGTIIPGHGGFLDRFDSVIFTAPLILIICQFIPLLQ